MCNPSPGPRCAGYLRTQIDKVTVRRDQATADGDRTRAALADTERSNLRFEYHGTRTGQRELNTLIDRVDGPRRAALEEVKQTSLASYRDKKAQFAQANAAAKAKTVSSALPAPAPAPVTPPAPRPAPVTPPLPAPAVRAVSHFTEQEAFSELRRRGITRVTVGFSGGNDEGGPDDITGHLSDGTTVPLHSDMDVYSHHRTETPSVYDYQAQTHRAATPEEITTSALATALEEPVYNNWSGFEGSFYVSGTVTWDVATGKVTEQSEEERYYDDDDDERED